MRALVVTSSGSMLVTNMLASLAEIQSTVDGNIEFINVGPGVHAYCNEDGKTMGLPINKMATRLANIDTSFDVLVGTVVFLGDGDDGEEGDLPDKWLQWATT